MSAIYLFRHGQAGPRHRYDTLSELGERQARLLGERLAAQGLHFDAVVAGGLERQQRTAAQVQGAYRDAGVAFPDITVDQQWNEFDLGAVYQQVAEPLSRTDPEFARLWAEMVRDMENEHAGVHRLHNYCDVEVVRAWVTKTHPYDGESWDSFRARIEQALHALQQRGGPGRKVAVFTSATPVGISVGKTLGLDETQIWRLAGVTYNSSMTSLRLGEDGELRLFSFNAVPHLENPEMWSFR
ncbi:MAG: histidine phosphatase family protein [Bryobacterales bacterium]|nr:histidine phosphatase family protein [Chrysiogenetes bacterium]MCB9383277.1 histidine phosphatase family protein [Bryobacterales bacterium]